MVQYDTKSDVTAALYSAISIPVTCFILPGKGSRQASKEGSQKK
jgi:hypothetical protein